nr:metal-dependent hydrolase [uncultured Enterobacter sp.]
MKGNLTSELTLRHMDFSFTPDEAHPYWLKRNATLAANLDALSLMFPEAERLFINSVKQMLKAHPDMEDAQEIARRFYFQEAEHTRWHNKYNRSLGLPERFVDNNERLLGRCFSWLRSLKPRNQLAVTCALEHLTSIGGKQVIGNPRWLEGASDEMKALWYWHAIEEVEHRSVPFDIYMKTGGNYPHRIFWSLASFVIFALLLLKLSTGAMKARGEFTLASIPGTLWKLYGWKGLYVTIITDFLPWFMPGFHPEKTKMDADKLAAAHKHIANWEKGQK